VRTRSPGAATDVAWTLADVEPAAAILSQGFALLSPAALAALTGVPASVLGDWGSYWDRLGPDEYLRDGGRYRRRRHGSFVHELGAGPDGDRLVLARHRPHWQSTAYNALHGGIERWFEPLEPSLVADPRWDRLLRSLGQLFAGLGVSTAAGGRQAIARWYVEAHPFRIDASDGLGRPTPEGAHRDGVDYVAVIVVTRHAVKGGETRVFEADGPRGIRFVIEQPWSALLLDDARVIHETTPIQPLEQPAWRDTLVITWRHAGFQAADQELSATGPSTAGLIGT
jgi:hypothetical protein